jgi:ribosomal protein S18 acetylase RimI-like enzyme
MIVNNTSPSVREDLKVRPAVSSDQQKIADLISFEAHVHRHLDWRTPLDWIGTSPYWVLEEGGRIVGALACPPDPDLIAWIRLFVFSSHPAGQLAWSALWDAARGQLAETGGALVAVIATQRWFDSILIESGFDLNGHITLLEWNYQSVKHTSLPSDINLRAMTSDDLPRVVEVDNAAFEPLWRNSLPALSKALSQASHAFVAEDASGMLGYELSTGAPLGAHLARLAVRPEVQGRGIGAALVFDLIERILDDGGSRLTVNTQANNAASLALYHKFGFHRTGEQFPVYTFRVDPAQGVDPAGPG